MSVGSYTDEMISPTRRICVGFSLLHNNVITIILTIKDDFVMPIRHSHVEPCIIASLLLIAIVYYSGKELVKNN